MELESDWGVAELGSPLGMLQRGRGAGWLAAVHEPVQGRHNLLACLTDDPRWDRQVEARGDYYATLALVLAVTPADIANLEPTADQWLRSETLEAMFSRGCEAAADYAVYLPEDVYRQDHVHSPRPTTPPPPPADAPVEVLLRELRNVPASKAVLHRLRTTRDPVEINTLRAAAQDPSGPGFRLATQALGARGDDSAVPTVSALLATNPTGIPRAASLRYLAHLPATVTLPLAREWLGLPDGRGHAAESILAAHAQAADIPQVRARLSTTTDYYTTCGMIDALARVPELGPYPELRTVFTDVRYSYTRWRAVRALAICDPDFSTTLATECLWDCEAATRAIACGTAPLNEETICRIHEIGADPAEDNDTRAAAAARQSTTTEN